jgi:hypothetical protein
VIAIAIEALLASSAESLQENEARYSCAWCCLLLPLQVAFMRNPSGKVVYDRRFNTAALLATYYGSNVDFAGRIDWDPKVGTAHASFLVHSLRGWECCEKLLLLRLAGAQFAFSVHA